MRKSGLISVWLGILCAFAVTGLLMAPSDSLNAIGDALAPVLVFASIILIGGGIALRYFHAETQKRKVVIRNLTIFSLVILLFGITSKLFRWPGASIEMIVGLVFYTFSALPLVIKGRYDARKTLIQGKTRLLNLADFLSFALIIIGVMFRVLHWPGANYVLGVGLAGVIISFINWNRSFRKEVKLRAETEARLQEAFAQLEQQHGQITEKNKEILDSIHYAERIQKTILPSDKLLQQELRDYFVWYQPRDIVSGDFYWGARSEGKFYLAVADSTGHGVPGAFMSLMNSNFLSEGLKEKGIKSPGDLLNYVRERLINALSEEEGEGGAQDGMDCVLMRLDLQERKIDFSAANNSLIVIRNNEVLEYEGNRMPVGRSVKNDLFETHHIELKEHDVIYAFTDGFGDQFGGPLGKKFKRKQVIQSLLEVHQLPMKEQHEILKKRFEQWMGNLEQLDDVLLVGIRV